MKGLHHSTVLSISQATLEDLDELVVLEKRAFSSPWSRKSFEAELWGNEFSLILVARCPETADSASYERKLSEQRIVGYICVWMVFEELRFMNIAVEAEWRRQGIGSKLVNKAIEIAKKQGVQRALLEVRESNYAAQALYNRFGFKSYGTRCRYYTNPNEDAMLMAREFLSLPRTHSD